MTEQNIDLLINQLRALKKNICKNNSFPSMLYEEQWQKRRERIHADMMANLFDLRNQERKVWHTMQEFKVSLDPETFHASWFHQYKLWTPNS